MPPILSKPCNDDACNDYKMRIEYILNPVQVQGPDNFVCYQPCTCTKKVKVDMVADIEKVYLSPQ